MYAWQMYGTTGLEGDESLGGRSQIKWALMQNSKPTLHGLISLFPINGCCRSFSTNVKQSKQSVASAYLPLLSSSSTSEVPSMITSNPCEPSPIEENGL